MFRRSEGRRRLPESGKRGGFGAPSSVNMDGQHRQDGGMARGRDAAETLETEPRAQQCGGRSAQVAQRRLQWGAAVPHGWET